MYPVSVTLSFCYNDGIFDDNDDKNDFKNIQLLGILSVKLPFDGQFLENKGPTNSGMGRPSTLLYPYILKPGFRGFPESADNF